MSVYLDADGNAWLRPVTVIALHTTTEVFTIGEGHVPLSGEQGEYRAAAGSGELFEGGSGRNWRLSDAPAGVQAGVYRPTAPDAWESPRNPAWTWTRNPGDGSLSLHDGTDTVAGTTGPVGGLTGVPSAGTYPITDWVLSAYYPGTAAYYDAPGYPLWVMGHDLVTGDVLIQFGVDVMLSRIGGSTTDPSGVFTASPAAEVEYNGGAAWTYTVTSNGLTGTAASTAYGEATYGGVPFTIDLESEGGMEFPTQRATVRAADSTAQGGFYQPVAWQEWVSEDAPGWVASLDATGAGELTDGTDIVATRAADASKPYDLSGSWEPTAYGKATYGPATATTAGTRSAGTFPEQAWRLTQTLAGVEYREGVTDPLVWIELDTATGDALLKDGTGTVAERLGGSLGDPDGSYASTTHGADTYNGGAAWTYDVATTTAGGDFTIEAGLDRSMPLEGYWWVELILDSGTNEVVDTAGPKFGASLPANSTTLAAYPVAYSDGAGLVTPILTGPIQWRP